MTSEDHSNRTRIETYKVYGTEQVGEFPQKIIPIEQGLKPRYFESHNDRFVPQKIIPIEQGLKLKTAKPGSQPSWPQKIIPIEQGLKLDGLGRGDHHG